MTSIASMFTGTQIMEALRVSCQRNKQEVEADSKAIAEAILSTPTGKLVAEGLGSERMGGVVMGMLLAFELLSGSSETVN